VREIFSKIPCFHLKFTRQAFIKVIDVIRSKFWFCLCLLLSNRLQSRTGSSIFVFISIEYVNFLDVLFCVCGPAFRQLWEILDYN